MKIRIEINADWDKEHEPATKPGWAQRLEEELEFNLENEIAGVIEETLGEVPRTVTVSATVEEPYQPPAHP